MDNYDERIAKAKLQKRLDKQNNNTGSSDRQEDKVEFDLKSVMEQINSGKLLIENREFNFERFSMLKGKLIIPMPLSFFKTDINTESNISIVNENQGVSFNGAYVKNKTKPKTFDEFKSELQLKFKKMGFFLKWLEEGRIEDNSENPIKFGSYEIPTGRGYVYNFIFYKCTDDSVFIGTYNFFKKDIKIWLPIIKATLLLTQIRI